MQSYFPTTALVAVIFIISCSVFPPTEAKNVSFTVDLIHRDSPESPLYNPHLSHFQRLEKAFERSLQRSNKFGSSYLIPDDGEYLMKISYGTPPFESFAIVDTGSDLTWIQCFPCINCYPSKYPPFNPRYSSTFRFLACPSTSCQQSNPKNYSCKPMNRPCPYGIRYGDNSYTRGNLVTDTITLGSRSQKVSFTNFLFGCGHDNGGRFPEMASGIVGFTAESHSLVSQLSNLIRGKFSFCLAPYTEVYRPGKLSFGNQAIVSGPGVVSTPLILDTHYSLILRGVSVGTQLLKFSDHNFSSNDSRKLRGGNIIIDSGTTLTLLLPDLYSRLERRMRSQIHLNPLPNPRGPFTLCYSSLRDADMPKVVFHFLGADVKLKPMNIFVRTSPSSVCLAFVPARIAIFGNIAQTNFLVGYDIVRKMVSFKPADCAGY